MAKTPIVAQATPARRANGRKAKSWTSLLNAVFQRTPQNAASDVAVAGDCISGLAGTPVHVGYSVMKGTLEEYLTTEDWRNKRINPNPYLKRADTKVMGKYDAYYYDTDFHKYPDVFQEPDDPIPSDFSSVIVSFDHPKKMKLIWYDFSKIYSPNTLEDYIGSISIDEERLVKS